MQYKLADENMVFIYDKPNKKANKIGVLKNTQTVTFEEKITDWGKIKDRGWVQTANKDGLIFKEIEPPSLNRIYDKATSNANTTSGATNTNTESADLKLLKEGTDIDIQDLDLGDYSNLYTTDTGSDELLNSLYVNTLRGIHGMPYQFLPHVDRRLEPGKINSFGRVYAEKIVARMPLLILTPGIPKFLSQYNDAAKKGVIEAMFSGSEKSNLDILFNKEGRYYTFQPAGLQYYKYVNPWLRTASQFLEIGGTRVDGQALRSFDWQRYTNDRLHHKLAYRHSVAFYIDSEHQVSESIGNDTTQSQIASKINGYSDMARELNFVLGGTDSAIADKVQSMIGQENLLQNQENLGEFSDRLLGSNGFFTKILNNFQTILSGGKLVFPEIWSDSSFGKSYNINIKLRCPDNDILSWYLSIYVPLVHIMCLAMPRGAGPNGYIAPFLIRAFYKGFLNIDTGIITGLDITKGGEGRWTQRGLPTSVDVSITIKDLYNIMSMTSNDDIRGGLLNNIALMDYIANSCGININEPEIIRDIAMFCQQNIANRVTDFFKIDAAMRLDQWVSNGLARLLTFYNSK